jgi:hypothetical protein
MPTFLDGICPQDVALDKVRLLLVVKKKVFEVDKDFVNTPEEASICSKFATALYGKKKGTLLAHSLTYKDSPLKIVRFKDTFNVTIRDNSYDVTRLQKHMKEIKLEKPIARAVFQMSYLAIPIFLALLGYAVFKNIKPTQKKEQEEEALEKYMEKKEEQEEEALEKYMEDSEKYMEKKEEEEESLEQKEEKDLEQKKEEEESLEQKEEEEEEQKEEKYTTQIELKSGLIHMAPLISQKGKLLKLKLSEFDQLYADEKNRSFSNLSVLFQKKSDKKSNAVLQIISEHADRCDKMLQFTWNPCDEKISVPLDVVGHDADRGEFVTDTLANIQDSCKHVKGKLTFYGLKEDICHFMHRTNNWTIQMETLSNGLTPNAENFEACEGLWSHQDLDTLGSNIALMTIYDTFYRTAIHPSVNALDSYLLRGAFTLEHGHLHVSMECDNAILDLTEQLDDAKLKIAYVSYANVLMQKNNKKRYEPVPGLKHDTKRHNLVCSWSIPHNEKCNESHELYSRTDSFFSDLVKKIIYLNTKSVILVAIKEGDQAKVLLTSFEQLPSGFSLPIWADLIKEFKDEDLELVMHSHDGSLLGSIAMLEIRQEIRDIVNIVPRFKELYKYMKSQKIVVRINDEDHYLQCEYNNNLADIYIGETLLVKSDQRINTEIRKVHQECVQLQNNFYNSSKSGHMILAHHFLYICEILTEETYVTVREDVQLIFLPSQDKTIEFLEVRLLKTKVNLSSILKNATVMLKDGRFRFPDWQTEEAAFDQPIIPDKLYTIYSLEKDKNDDWTMKIITQAKTQFKQINDHVLIKIKKDWEPLNSIWKKKLHNALSEFLKAKSTYNENAITTSTYSLCLDPEYHLGEFHELPKPTRTYMINSKQIEASVYFNFLKSQLFDNAPTRKLEKTKTGFEFRYMADSSTLKSLSEEDMHVVQIIAEKYTELSINTLLTPEYFKSLQHISKFEKFTLDAIEDAQSEMDLFRRTKNAPDRNQIIQKFQQDLENKIANDFGRKAFTKWTFWTNLPKSVQATILAM